ncbi:ABC transporter substrate-binding protein [Labrys wisconsinensis]|uniref:NitT/TauT family transport system substrate-binding protein n=1 Tax=Labrys wisconsinensis TaxID=425677 RepID=A0ABU0J0T1_9HYPH|nr:NitT/TauT family transport system substrate-binding protein [Labrys wisconsinensis]
MDLLMNRRRLMQAGAGLALGATAFGRAFAQEIPAKPEAGAIKMAIEPWLGYGQWHVAAKKGLFKAAGLDEVEIVNFTTDADLNAALASGQTQCGNIATHTAMAFAAAGLPIKIVALLDVSMTADAMITDGSVASIADLKGKQVAFEEGTTSDILLNYALSKNGMTIADIQKVPMPAADAGTALIAGKVPVAVTYEPYISLAKTQSDKVKLLFTAGENPGLISDVFVVREEFLAAKPGQVVALLKAWDAALSAYRADTTAAQAIIAEAVGAKPEELKTAFEGVTYYSLAENRTHLSGDFLAKVVPEVKAAATKAGLLTKDVDVAKLIDGRFVDAASK